MCDIDDGERCSVWMETQRRARKDHRCDACDGLIGAGEVYLVHFSVYEDHPTSEKMCVECEVDRKEFADAHNGMLYPPGGLQELLESCINEGTISDDEGQTVLLPEDARWQSMLDAMAARKMAALGSSAKAGG